MRKSLGDCGSGGMFSVALLATVVLLGGLGFSASVALREATRLQSVANLAALAASDVARGRVSGIACDTARQIADLSSLALESCTVVDGSARVFVQTTVFGFSIQKRAHAGPAPHPAWVDG